MRSWRSVLYIRVSVVFPGQLGLVGGLFAVKYMYCNIDLSHGTSLAGLIETNNVFPNHLFDAGASQEVNDRHVAEQ